MSDSLFDAPEIRQRLEAAGWKEIEIYGTRRWEHPVSRAWYPAKEAIAKLEEEQEK